MLAVSVVAVVMFSGRSTASTIGVSELVTDCDSADAADATELAEDETLAGVSVTGASA